MSVTRISRDWYFLYMATLVSLRSTCIRRHTGCVIVSQQNHVLATGYNGVPKFFPHCIDSPCSGSSATPGEKLDECLAIHAEANALLQCADVQAIDTVYCTDSPCVQCTKLLLNTSVRRILFSRPYPHDELCRGYAEYKNVVWRHVELTWPLVLEQSYARQAE